LPQRLLEKKERFIIRKLNQFNQKIFSSPTILNFTSLAVTLIFSQLEIIRGGFGTGGIFLIK